MGFGVPAWGSKYIPRNVSVWENERRRDRIKKKIGLGTINRLKIVTKNLAQGVIPATEINVFLVVSVEENYVW